jgi:hypothetical protein
VFRIGANTIEQCCGVAHFLTHTAIRTAKSGLISPAGVWPKPLMFFDYSLLVPRKGLEPPRLAALAPEDMSFKNEKKEKRSYSSQL